MRTLSTVLIALAFAIITNASYSIPGTFTGYGPATNQRPPRQNIIKLQTDAYQWPLYIQALSAFQAADQNDQFSYYQIAGIHGRPYIPWDNSHGTNDNAYTGYCTHDSPLFITWHRPFLALYEQLLAQRVQAIAQQYLGRPDTAQWLNAANKFRIPYWDWAETQTMPAIVSQQQITITTASGSRTMANPLYTYRFHPLNANDFPPSSGFLATQPQTIRGANTNGLLSAWNVKTNTYATFQESNYLRYAMQSSGGASIESVHGSVHMAVAGGDGNKHMAQLAYSGFDPTFWLHHANVDRLAAMWQAIWQDVYLPASGASDPYGNYALNPGTTVYPSTPLRPFWRSNSQGYWDSNSVRSTAAFGYTYPELNDWSRNSVQQRSDAAAAANVLYGPFSFSMKRDNTDLTPRQQWFATVSCKKFALDSSYSIILFLGSPPADIKDWYTASNLVAVMPVFVPPQVPGTKRPTPSELTTNSEYLLDDALDKAGMYDRSAEILEPYLHEKLTWRILKLNGSEVAVEDVQGLRIGVYEKEMTPPAVVTDLPTYGQPYERPDATKGKLGGAA